MRPKLFLSLTLVTILLLVFSGCTPTPASTLAAFTQTPPPAQDRCSAENLPGEIAKLDELTGEFAEVLELAGVTPQEQLAPVILRLQDIRRSAEKLNLPECTATLKTGTVDYMNQVISYLTLFMGGTNAADVINNELAKSDGLKTAYETERARLLNVAYEPQPTRTPLPTTVVVTVSNTGATEIPLYDLPRDTATVVGSMQPGGQANAIARTADNAWLLIPVSEEQYVCVQTALVTVTGAVDQLPVFEETVQSP